MWKYANYDANVHVLFNSPKCGIICMVSSWMKHWHQGYGLDALIFVIEPYCNAIMYQPLVTNRAAFNTTNNFGSSFHNPLGRQMSQSAVSHKQWRILHFLYSNVTQSTGFVSMHSGANNRIYGSECNTLFLFFSGWGELYRNLNCEQTP